MIISALKRTWHLQFAAYMVLVAIAYHFGIIQIQAPFYKMSTFAVGLVSTAHFVGFLASCLFLVRFVHIIGPIRMYSAMAAVYAVITIAFSFATNVPSWIALNIIGGFCAGGIFIVIESWLNELSNNNNRGQVIALYVVVLTAGKIMGNYTLNFFDDNDVRQFSLAALFILMTILPMLTMNITVKNSENPQKMPLSRLFATSPAAVVIMFLCQIGAGIVNGLGITFAKLLGFSTLDSANLMSVIFIATIIMQYPIGKLSDMTDRRMVMIGVAVMLLLGSVGVSYFAPETPLFWISLFFMGGTVFSLYPLCLAHMNDFLTDNKRVAASGQMLLLASAGSMMGPITASTVMNYIGYTGFSLTIAVQTMIIIIYLLYRMQRRKGLARDEQHQRHAFALSPLVIPFSKRAKKEENNNE